MIMVKYKNEQHKVSSELFVKIMKDRVMGRKTKVLIEEYDLPEDFSEIRQFLSQHYYRKSVPKKYLVRYIRNIVSDDEYNILINGYPGDSDYSPHCHDRKSRKDPRYRKIQKEMSREKLYNRIYLLEKRGIIE